MVVLYHTAIGLCYRHVTVKHYRLLTKTSVQRWFHHTLSVTILLHTLILLLL